MQTQKDMDCHHYDDDAHTHRHNAQYLSHGKSGRMINMNCIESSGDFVEMAQTDRMQKSSLQNYRWCYLSYDSIDQILKNQALRVWEFLFHHSKLHVNICMKGLFSRSLSNKTGRVLEYIIMNNTICRWVGFFMFVWVSSLMSRHRICHLFALYRSVLVRCTDIICL